MRGRARWRYRLILALALASGVAAGDDIREYRITREGRQLEIAIGPGIPAAADEKLRAWIDHIATALARVYGHWPRRQWQIAIAPASGRASDPIPWAEVRRGEIDRVEFFTVAAASLEELQRAWTGYHELAHLLIPYRGWGDAWFSEGLASYYQDIMQARSGTISERQMWQRLYDGFQRGRAQSEFDGQTLAAVSDGMRETGAFMRVYWSGAWYFLAADTRLRLQSGGRQSLDQALAALNRCCADQQLSVPGIVARLDELNRLVLFEPLYAEAAASERVPDFESLFAILGIDVVDGQVRLQQAGPGARLRRQIAGGSDL